MIFGRELLSIPPHGCINLHGSLLPAYRGRAPVNWAIINGEKETGITFHYMTEKVDAGPIISQERIKIESYEIGLSLTKKIASCGAELLAEIIAGLHQQNLSSTQQDESKATYFKKRTPSMGKIDWKWDGVKISNYVRALTRPFPGAFFVLNDKKCLIWKGEERDYENGEFPGSIISINKDSLDVGTGSGCYRITQIEIEGKGFTPRGFAEYFQLKKGDALGG
jgi:UDP-4-amino-4-deoxy-L-arabinose formyltransferase/UDP-glucuronic acid dehydrogenase (UDP-4-keto-hexauronic acid decarboxylating)